PIDAKNGKGDTALHHAFNKDRSWIFQQLLIHKANLNEVDAAGKTVLLKALEDTNRQPYARKLILEGASIKDPSYLLAACRSCNLLLARLLLERGCDVNGKSDNEVPLTVVLGLFARMHREEGEPLVQSLEYR